MLVSTTPAAGQWRPTSIGLKSMRCHACQLRDTEMSLAVAQAVCLTYHAMVSWAEPFPPAWPQCPFPSNHHWAGPCLIIVVHETDAASTDAEDESERVKPRYLTSCNKASCRSTTQHVHRITVYYQASCWSIGTASRHAGLDISRTCCQSVCCSYFHFLFMSMATRKTSKSSGTAQTADV